MDIPMYITQCAPQVAFSTMHAIVKTESNYNHLAIGLNKGFRLKYQSHNMKQAQGWVDYLERNNYNFDVGLGQINIKNIHKYGYKARDLLDPCLNLKISADILQKNYRHALLNSLNTKDALQKAISAYNTGNFKSGFSNGYVSRVYLNAGNKLKIFKVATNRPKNKANLEHIKTTYVKGEDVFKEFF